MPPARTTYWSNDGTSTAGSEPAAAVTLTVTKGLYSVLLGDATLPNMTVVPATVFTNADVCLRVWFNDGTNGSQLLTPDQRIAAVGYAMMAGNVPDGAITGGQMIAAVADCWHPAARNWRQCGRGTMRRQAERRRRHGCGGRANLNAGGQSGVATRRAWYRPPRIQHTATCQRGLCCGLGSHDWTAVIHGEQRCRWHTARPPRATFTRRCGRAAR